MPEAKPKDVLVYLRKNGTCPFEEWFNALKDKTVGARIAARVTKIRYGMEADEKMVGEGVWESRMHFGAGYRLYYGRQGEALIVLLIGGDKKSQDKDIARAKDYWTDYLKVRSAKTK